MTEQDLINEDYVAGKKSFSFLIRKINEGFNWDLVHKVMLHLNWVWHFGKENNGQDQMGVPNVQTIQNNALDLLKQAYDGEMLVSSGGFSAGWEDGELFLVFTLESYQTF